MNIYWPVDCKLIRNSHLKTFFVCLFFRKDLSVSTMILWSNQLNSQSQGAVRSSTSCPPGELMQKATSCTSKWRYWALSHLSDVTTDWQKKSIVFFSVSFLSRDKWRQKSRRWVFPDWLFTDQGDLIKWMCNNTNTTQTFLIAPLLHFSQEVAAW